MSTEQADRVDRLITLHGCECTVQYLGTTTLKFTMTKENVVRIKIPDRFIGSMFEQMWIDNCEDFIEILLKIPREHTIRGKNSVNSKYKTNPMIHLYEKGTATEYFGCIDVFNSKFIPASLVNLIKEGETDEDKSAIMD